MQLMTHFRSGALCLSMLLATAGATTAQAQTIKPLDVEQDPNGVDLFTGKVATRLPELSIPAAGNLRLQKLQDFMPMLSGMFSSNTYGPSSASFEVNGGGASSDSFTCPDGDCRTRKKNGSHLISINGGLIVEYYQGGSGKLIYFDQQNGTPGLPTSATGLSLYASYIRYPDGETISFTYDVFTAPNGQLWRRPTILSSSLGYTMTLTYQSPTYGTSGWGALAQATIAQTSNPSVPLARLTYSGATIIDLAGRQYTCTNCTNGVSGPGTTTVTTLKLPGDSGNSFETEAQTRTYGSVTHANFVTRVTNAGVDWNYSYLPGPSPQTTVSKVTVTAALGFSRIVNIYQTAVARPRITSTVNPLGQTTSYEYDSDVRVNRITRPEGNAETVVYDQIGNIIERKLIAKPGSGLADIVETAYYGNHDPWSGDLCHSPECFKPIWTRDALGRQTDYTWGGHGGLLTSLEPADANSQRRKTINSYDASARMVQERKCMANAAGAELTCGTAAEVRTEYSYWGATRLPSEVRQINQATAEILRTCFKYDAAGNKISETQPLGAGTVCP